MFGLSRFAIQAIALISGGGLLVTSCVVRDRSVEQRGASKVLAVSKQAGARANEINRKVRAAARQPGAFERLLKSSCRDC